MFLCGSGQGEGGAAGEDPGDGGGQAGPGPLLPGVPVQPLLHPGPGPASGSGLPQTPPQDPGGLEGTDTPFISLKINLCLFIYHSDLILSLRGCDWSVAPLGTPLSLYNT